MKNQRQKALVIAISLIVVLAFFGQDMLKQLGVNIPFNSISSISSSEPSEVWLTFSDYRESVRTHNLDKLKKLSYRLSPTCLDESKLKECVDLMDNLYEMIKEIKFEDIASSVEDDGQAAIQTWGPVALSFHFIRAEESLKLVGIKYCLETGKERCTLSQSDSDNDGLWDTTEEFLR